MRRTYEGAQIYKLKLIRSRRVKYNDIEKIIRERERETE